MAEEVRFHLETEIEELIALGLAPADARARALAQFGDVGRAISECNASDRRRMRRAKWTQLQDTIRQETRHVLRGFGQRPAFTATVIGTLALGVGANAAVFAIVDRIFFRPPAGVSEPSHLRRLYTDGRSERGASSRFALPQAGAIVAGLTSAFPTTIYGISDRTRVDLPDAETRYVGAGWITPNFLNTLGVRIAAGRDFESGDLQFGQPARSVILSWNFWQRMLGGRQNIIGQALRVGGQQMTVVGVTPRGFSGIDATTIDIWLPLSGSRLDHLDSPRRWWHDRGTSAWQLVSRLPPGGSEQQLLARAGDAYRTELRQHLAANPRSPWVRDTSTVVSAGSIVNARGPAKLSREMSIAALLAGVATLVLVIATANVGNLLLGRGMQRKREMAVRLALGMSRGRLMGQLLLESAMLGIFAAVAATIAAIWIGGTLRSLLFPTIDWAGGPVDFRIAVFAALIGVVGGIVAGLVPAHELMRVDLGGAIKSGAREGGARNRAFAPHSSGSRRPSRSCCLSERGFSPDHCRTFAISIWATTSSV